MTPNVLAAGVTIVAVVGSITKALKATGKALGNGLKAIGTKVASILPGLVGSIVSFLFKTAGEVVVWISSVSSLYPKKRMKFRLARWWFFLPSTLGSWFWRRSSLLPKNTWKGEKAPCTATPWSLPWRQWRLFCWFPVENSLAALAWGLLFQKRFLIRRASKKQFGEPGWKVAVWRVNFWWAPCHEL